MTGPDGLVAQSDETVTHEFVTDYNVDDNGQVEPDSIVVDTVERPAIVSSPSEEDEQRHEGRLSTGSFRLTLLSDADVKGDRGGRRDRFAVRGQWTEVVEVRDDTHPITGTQKLTVLVDRLDGHVPEPSG